ncbi:MAG: PAS domain S-box protein [Phycisphaerales bacterium]|nr:MAG: PAS domain S-box protein [Phycisphaerales bacterium]
MQFTEINATFRARAESTSPRARAFRIHVGGEAVPGPVTGQPSAFKGTHCISLCVVFLVFWGACPARGAGGPVARFDHPQGVIIRDVCQGFGEFTSRAGIDTDALGPGRGACPARCVDARGLRSPNVIGAALSVVPSSWRTGWFATVAGACILAAAVLVAGLFVRRAGSVADRARAERALRRQAMVFKSIHDGVLLIGADGRIIDWNPGAQRMFGYAKEEILGKSPDVLNGPAEAAALTRAVQDGLRSENRWSGDIRFVRKDGTEGVCETIVVPVLDGKGNRIGTVAVNRDITDSKRAEEKLRLFAQAVDNSIEGMAMGDLESRITYVNEAFAKMFGYSREEMIGKSIASLHPEEQTREVEQALEDTVRGGWSGELIGKRKNGDLFPVAVCSSRVVDDAGNVIAHMASHRDVTEKRRAEEALRSSEERFRTVVHASKDAMVAVNSQGLVTLFNPAAEEMFGRQAKEMIGQPLDVLMPEDYREPHRQFVKSFFATGESRRVIGKTVERPALRSDGNVFPIELSLSAGRSAKERFVLAVIRDATERKQADALARERQAEFCRLARLGTVGEMATELAHELNQPLAAINNYTEACLRRIESETVTTEELLGAVRQIAGQSERAADVVRRVREFSRRQEPRMAPVDLNAVIQEAIEFEEYAARMHNVHTRFEPEPGIPPIEVDKIQIQQVLLNLFHNAIDAMKHIEGRRRELCVTTARHGKDAVEVTVTDTGEGFSPGVSEHLFEPFFTTKSDGTGLGLSISKTILDAHRGCLSARPNDRFGATFQFTLPVRAS